MSEYKVFRCKDCNELFTFKMKHKKSVICPFHGSPLRHTRGNVELVE